MAEAFMAGKTSQLLFYSYSTDVLDYVKSQRKLGDVTQSDLDTANKQATLTDAIGSKVDAIYLYLNPQNEERIAKVSLMDLSKPVYENAVGINNLPVNVVWGLRDTKAYLAERENFSKQAEGNVNVDTHMNNWMRKNGHTGRGIDALQKALKKYTTNFIGRRDRIAQPILEFYPYVGYLRVASSTMKSF